MIYRKPDTSNARTAANKERRERRRTNAHTRKKHADPIEIYGRGKQKSGKGQLESLKGLVEEIGLGWGRMECPEEAYARIQAQRNNAKNKG